MIPNQKPLQTKNKQPKIPKDVKLLSLKVKEPTMK